VRLVPVGVEAVRDVAEQLQARTNAEQKLAGRFAKAEPILVAWK
jgi:hypothetical protein